MPIVQELKQHPLAVGIGAVTLLVTYALFRRSRTSSASGGALPPNTGGGVIQPGYNNDQNLSYLIQSLSDWAANAQRQFQNPPGGGTPPVLPPGPSGGVHVPGSTIQVQPEPSMPPAAFPWRPRSSGSALSASSVSQPPPFKVFTGTGAPTGGGAPAYFHA